MPDHNCTELDRTPKCSGLRLAQKRRLVHAFNRPLPSPPPPPAQPPPPALAVVLPDLAARADGILRGWAREAGHHARRSRKAMVAELAGTVERVQRAAGRLTDEEEHEVERDELRIRQR